MTQGDQTAALGRATGLMTASIFLSRITGFMRIFALAYAIGLFGVIPNSYNLANVMPNMFYELFAGGILSSILIPIITKHLVDGAKQEAFDVANTVTNLAIVVLGMLILTAILFPSPFVYSQTFLSRQTAPIEMITFFFQIFAPQILFYAIAAIHTAILFSHKKFFVATFAPVLNNLTVIATVLFFFGPAYERDPQLGLWVLAIGTTLGVVVMSLALLPSVIKLGLRYRPVLNLKHPSIARLKVLALPAVGYVALNQTGLAVTNAIAISYDGGVAAYQYAWPLFHIAYALLSYPISNALFPNLSEHSARKDYAAFREDISLGVRTIGYLLLPSTAVVYAMAGPLVTLLLDYGAFAANAGAAELTSSMLRGFALGIFSFSIWMFLTKAFYALEDTKTPAFVSIVGVSLNIALNLLLVQFIGVSGVAYGHAIAYTVASLLLLYLLRRRLNGLDGRRMVASLVPQALVGAASAALGAFAAYGIATVIAVDDFLGRSVQVSVAMLVAVLVYLVVTRLLRLPELHFMGKVIPGFTRLMRL